MADGTNNTTKPKIFGELGLGVGGLKKNVDDAKGYIKELHNEAVRLGALFKLVGKESNLDAISKELEAMVDDVSASMKDMEKKTKSASKAISVEQLKIVDAIKKGMKTGAINSADALKELAKTLDVLKAKYASFDKASPELLSKKSTIKEMKDVLGAIQSIEGEIVNINTKINKNIANTGKAIIQQAKNDQKNMLANAKAEQESYYKSVMNTYKLINSEDLGEKRKYLSQQLINEKLTADQITQVRIKLANVNSQIRQKDITLERQTNNEKLRLERERVAEINRINRANGITTNGFGDEQHRFKSLTDYAYNATIIYGMMQGVREMSQAFKQIEAESVNLARVMPNASSFDIAGLRENAFQIGNLTAQQVNDVQKIQNLWARASDDIANSKEAMEELTRVTSVGMNVGGFTNAEEAVQLLNATLNQMNLKWTDAGMVMDSWIKIADTTAVGTAKDLADATMRVGTQAQLLGMNYHDVNAITGVLANNMAKSGEEIGTALKTVFSYFQDEKAIQVLEKYGVQVKKNAKEYNNFVYIMEELQKAYKRLEADSNDQAMHEINNALGRIRRVDYVGTLISNWGEYKEVVETSLGASGYSMAQNEKVMDTFQAKVGQLQVAFQQLSWSVGESGLLEDLKALTMGLTRGVQWFNSLDPSIKTGTLRLLEMATAMALLSKTTNLLTGMGLVKFLANSTAELAYATGSQWLFNIAKQAGATIEVVNTQAKTANTASTYANAVATDKATVSQIALNNSKLAGAGASGLLSGAMGALFNPITAVVAVVALATAGFFAYKKSMEEAKKEAEAMAQAEDDLQKMMSKKVVSDTDMGGYESKIGQLQEMSDKLQEAKRNADQAKQALDGFTGYHERSGTHNRLVQNYSEANKAVKEYEKQLGLLGSSAENVEEDITALTDVVDRSSNAQLRNAYNLVDTIEKEQQRNEKIKIAISDYVRLHDEVMKTGVRTAEYNRVVNLLNNTFPQLKSSIDGVTGATILDIKAMQTAIGTTGALTEAQLAQIQMMANVDESSKKLALDMVKIEIDKTQAVVDGSTQRIKALKAEAEAMVNTNKVMYNALMSKYNSGAELTEGEGRWLYGYGSTLGRMMGDIKAYDNIVAKLDGMKSKYNAIDNIKILSDIDYDTPIAGDGGSASSDIEDYNPDTTGARYTGIKNALAQLNNELERNQALSDTSTESKKKDLLEKEIGLIKQKQDMLHQLNEEQRLERSELKTSLQSKGFTFDENGIANYAKRIKELANEVNKMSEADDVSKEKKRDAIQKIKELEDAVKRFTDLNNTEIPNASKEWLSLQKNIAGNIDKVDELNNKMQEQIEKNIRNGLEFQKNYALQMLQYQQQKEELDLQQQIFGMTLEAYNLSIEQQINDKQQQLDQLDDEIDKREYLNKLNEIDAEIAKVKADTRFSYIDEATGQEIYTYDRNKVKELEEQKADLVQDKADADAKEKLQDEIKALQDQSAEKKKQYDKQLADLKQFHQFQMDSFNFYWQQRMTDEAIQQEAERLIKEKGHEQALSDSQNFLNKYKQQYEKQKQPMYDAGLAINQALKDGISSNMQVFLSQQEAMIQAWVARMRAMIASVSMMAGGGGGGGSSFSGGAGAMFAGAGMATFHEGGFVGGQPINNKHEIIAKLLEGEYVVSGNTLDKLSFGLPSTRMDSTTMKTSNTTVSTTDKSTKIYIGEIKANNFEEMINSLSPYIEAE